MSLAFKQITWENYLWRASLQRPQTSSGPDLAHTYEPDAASIWVSFHFLSVLSSRTQHWAALKDILAAAPSLS